MVELTSGLPNGRTYSWIHLRTNAYKCKAPTASLGLSYKAKHLLLLADDTAHVIVFGVEVYVYFTVLNHHMTRQIFVPKADTTGLGGRFSAATVMEWYLDLLLGLGPEVYFETGADREIADLKSMKKNERENETGVNADSKNSGLKADGKNNGLNPDGNDSGENDIVSEYSVVNDLRRMGRDFAQKGKSPVAAYEVSGKPVQKLPLPEIHSESIKISMFTRAADAYLFPDSQKNPGKHVASGNTLFKWWLVVLQKVVSKYKKWELKADIPGSDSNAVGRLLPAGCSVGTIYPLEADVLKTIPVFPDDPKGRFLEHLVVENRVSHMTVAQFWHELGYRQEFRLGNVVGIIGAEGPSVSPQETRTTEFIQGSTLVSVKKYKKLRDYVKGHDYSKLDDIQEVWEHGLRELCIRQKVKLQESHITGTREARRPQEPGPQPTSVNVLQLKKLPAVNNINGLVKKKK